MLSRWQSTIVDERGNVQPLANLTVRNEADQSLAKMWASPGTTQPLPDGMVQADGNGYAFFYARGGLYRITSVALGIDWRGVQIGAALVSIGDYAAGLEITARNQTFWRDGELYRAGAALELPYTTTGDWGAEEGLFVAVGDQSLRQDLASDDGAEIIGFKKDIENSVHQSAYVVLNRTPVTPEDFGAVEGAGIDNTVPLQDFFNASTSRPTSIGFGIYDFHETISLDPSKTYIINGAAWDNRGSTDVVGTQLRYRGAENAIEIINDTGTNFDKQVMFRNLTLTGMPTSRNGIFALRVPLFLENVWLRDHGYDGAYLERCYSSAFKQASFSRNYRNGCRMNLEANAIHFDHCIFNGNSRVNGYAGLRLDGDSTVGGQNLGVVLTACDFTFNGSGGDITEAYGLVAFHNRGLIMNGCYGEQNKFRNVYIDGTNKGVSIDSNYWQDGITAIAGVEGLRYTNNFHQQIFQPTEVRISSPTGQRYEFDYSGNTFAGGASEIFTGGAGPKPATIFGNSPPTSGVWRRGDSVLLNTASSYSKGFVCLSGGSPGVWGRLDHEGVQSRGQGNITLNPNSNAKTQIYASPISANMSIDFSVDGAVNGDSFRISRLAAATGSGSIFLNASTSKQLNLPGMWCDVTYFDGLWRITATGEI